MAAMPQFARHERIERVLTSVFAPDRLVVMDESAAHAGHLPHDGAAGYDGETHFRIRISSARFAGMSRLQRHRAVNEALAEEFHSGLHALALEIKAPGE